MVNKKNDWSERTELKELAVRVISFMLSLILGFVAVVRVSAANTEEISEEESQRREKAIERMISGFENMEEKIDISDLGILPEELKGVFSAATKNSPYLFFVGNDLRYTFRKGGCVVSVMPQYLYSEAEVKAMTEFCKTEISKLSSLARHGKSELERVIFLHDLICERFSYDLTLKNNNLCSFLKAGKGTCQGYTWTYMAALRELGIECEYVASDTIVHIWLRLKIDDEWYNSDVTWDDPPQNEGTGKKSRAHFLFSDAEAEIDGYVNRYSSSDVKCLDKKYDGEDFLLEYPFCTTTGDVDHDGKAGLKDLLLLRMYIDKGIENKSLCLACADADRNCVIDERDLNDIRKNILLSG